MSTKRNGIPSRPASSEDVPARGMEMSSSVSVVLRDVLDSDLPIFFEQQLDPAAIYMAAFTHKDPADRDAFDVHWRKIRGDKRVTIKTVLFDGRVAGHVASFVDEQFGKPEVTYWIGKEHWGRGIATNALTQFLEDQRVRPIYGRAARDNLASIRVLEKCGFRITGYNKGFANARGKEIEEAILKLGGTEREAREGVC